MTKIPESFFFFSQPHDRSILCLDVSQSGRFCVTGSADHSLRVYDLLSGRLKAELYNKRSGHYDWVTCCLFLSSNKVLSAGMDGKVNLWDTHTLLSERAASSLKGETPLPTPSLCFPVLDNYLMKKNSSVCEEGGCMKPSRGESLGSWVDPSVQPYPQFIHLNNILQKVEEVKGTVCMRTDDSSASFGKGKGWSSVRKYDEGEAEVDAFRRKRSSERKCLEDEAEDSISPPSFSLKEEKSRIRSPTSNSFNQAKSSPTEERISQNFPPRSVFCREIVFHDNSPVSKLVLLPAKLLAKERSGVRGFASNELGLSSGYDAKLRLFDVAKKMGELRVLDQFGVFTSSSASAKKIPIVAFDVELEGNDNYSIFSGDRAGNVCLWDVEAGRMVYKFNSAHSGPVGDILMQKGVPLYLQGGVGGGESGGGGDIRGGTARGGDTARAASTRGKDMLIPMQTYPPQPPPLIPRTPQGWQSHRANASKLPHPSYSSLADAQHTENYPSFLDLYATLEDNYPCSFVSEASFIPTSSQRNFCTQAGKKADTTSPGMKQRLSTNRLHNLAGKEQVFCTSSQFLSVEGGYVEGGGCCKPQGLMFSVGRNDGVLNVFDRRMSSLAASKKIHDGPVNRIFFTHKDQGTICTVSGDKSCKLFDVRKLGTKMKEGELQSLTSLEDEDIWDEKEEKGVGYVCSTFDCVGTSTGSYSSRKESSSLVGAAERSVYNTMREYAVCRAKKESQFCGSRGSTVASLGGASSALPPRLVCGSDIPECGDLHTKYRAQGKEHTNFSAQGKLHTGFSARSKLHTNFGAQGKEQTSFSAQGKPHANYSAEAGRKQHTVDDSYLFFEATGRKLTEQTSLIEELSCITFRDPVMCADYSGEAHEDVKLCIGGGDGSLYYVDIGMKGKTRDDEDASASHFEDGAPLFGEQEKEEGEEEVGLLKPSVSRGQDISRLRRNVPQLGKIHGIKNAGNSPNARDLEQRLEDHELRASDAELEIAGRERVANTQRSSTHAERVANTQRSSTHAERVSNTQRSSTHAERVANTQRAPTHQKLLPVHTKLPTVHKQRLPTHSLEAVQKVNLPTELHPRGDPRIPYNPNDEEAGKVGLEASFPSEDASLSYCRERNSAGGFTPRDGYNVSHTACDEVTHTTQKSLNARLSLTTQRSISPSLAPRERSLNMNACRKTTFLDSHTRKHAHSLGSDLVAARRRCGDGARKADCLNQRVSVDSLWGFPCVKRGAVHAVKMIRRTHTRRKQRHNKEEEDFKYSIVFGGDDGVLGCINL